MKKYTKAQIKKFLKPETRFHMSAHVIQTEALEMCRQLQAQLISSLVVIRNFMRCNDCEESHGEGIEALELMRELEIK